MFMTILVLAIGVFFIAPIAALYIHSEVSFWHSVCVAVNSKKLARKEGHGIVYSLIAYLNGLYHDVGKILVPRSILHKETRLTDEEFAIVKSHTSNWIARVYGVVFPAAIGHHKDFTGSGYGAEEIQSHISAIVEVCDVQNAITGLFRTYRGLTDDDVVITEMEKSQFKFDPELFVMFMSNYETFEMPKWIKNVDKKLREKAFAAKAID